jgi:hypothetical protein
MPTGPRESRPDDIEPGIRRRNLRIVSLLTLSAMTEERAYCFTSVATVTCGQLSPLKFKSTLWVY